MPANMSQSGGLPVEVMPVAMPITPITATVAGTGTGAMVENGRLQVVLVTASVNTKIVTLPPPIPGTLCIITFDATGCNLQSSAPATVAINGGTGASAKSAIPASTTVYAFCETATAWKCLQQSSTAGTLAACAAAS